MPDLWDDGASYESYVGRWSRGVAREFVRWLHVEPGAAWLDFGCGTGALTQSILAGGSPGRVIGCDRSPGYVEFAGRQTTDPRAEFVVAELPRLPHVPGGFDAAVAGLVLNFLPDPTAGVAAMLARVRKGGSVAAYVWDYAEGMQLIRTFWDAVVALDPASRELDEGLRFPLCQPDALRGLFELAGLRDVLVQPIVVRTDLRDFDDYWAPFLRGQGPAPGYVSTLSTERLAELRDSVRQHLPTAPNGTIPLTARAWAVKGTAA
jgi:SAM-dependent methyltransferase